MTPNEHIKDETKSDRKFYLRSVKMPNHMHPLKNIAYWIGITLILSSVGFYNGYPLVYSDTGTYIYSGFDQFIPFDRPITYGLFVEFFSFEFSLWPVVLIQNFLTVFILFHFIRLFGFEDRTAKNYLFYLTLFLTLFTGIGWYSNQIMPDFFAPLVLLTLPILILGKQTNVVKAVLMGILIYGLIAHFSHLLIALVLVGSMWAVKFIWLRKEASISRSRLIQVSVVILAAWIILPLINYGYEKKFVVSKGSHVFLMAHLNDTGILKKFLDENCASKDFSYCKLCQQKDSLPSDLAGFIWEGDFLTKMGGWEGSEKEFNKIIRATIKRPNYLMLNAYKSFTYGLIQLTQNDIGQGLTAYGEGSAPYGQIHWRFRHELNNYMNSRQNKWDGVNLNFKTLNLVHHVLLLLSVAMMIYLYASGRWSGFDFNTRFLLLFLISGVIINAFISAGLNAPCERFQARVVWLIPMVLLLIALKHRGIFKLK